MVSDAGRCDSINRNLVTGCTRRPRRCVAGTNLNVHLRSAVTLATMCRHGVLGAAARATTPCPEHLQTREGDVQ